MPSDRAPAPRQRSNSGDINPSPDLARACGRSLWYQAGAGGMPPGRETELRRVGTAHQMNSGAWWAVATLQFWRTIQTRVMLKGNQSSACYADQANYC